MVGACHAGPLMPVSKLGLQDLPADWCLDWGKGRVAALLSLTSLPR